MATAGQTSDGVKKPASPSIAAAAASIPAGGMKAPEKSNGEAKPAKVTREVTLVKMTDGRTVEFVGKRRMLKDTLLDESKIKLEGNALIIHAGAIKTRLDFRNGETRTFDAPLKLVPKSSGHGWEQKLGDETAGTEKVEDMILEVDALIDQLKGGDWTTQREAGGFSGASIVIRAIMEASGKSQDQVKAFLQGKIDAATARGEKMSRKALYDSFRNPTSKVGKIVERLEREERSGKAVVDADAALAELG